MDLIKFLLKAIIGVAALVFFFANPFRSKEQALAFFASILVILVCGGFAAWLKDDDEQHPQDDHLIN